MAEQDDSAHRRRQRPSPASQARLRATVDRLMAFTRRQASSADTPARPPRRLRPSFFEGEILARRYRIVRFIAGGGVGEVYEAEDLDQPLRVALKTVRRDVAEDPDIMERFRREVRYARRIDHPNVCRTFEIDQHLPEGKDEPTTFLTMELLEGSTLEDLLGHAKRLDVDQALPLAEQLIDGLAAAHAAGIVHRDLKTGNVMLVRPEEDRTKVRAVITDFGLALGAVEDSSVEDASSLTRTGQIIGTLSYMAPEQLRGEKATRATDIYALGLLLYEMVTGERPFPGRNSFAAAVRRLDQPPDPPSYHLPSLDPAWESAILRCLELEPEDRFERVEDVIDALRSNSTRKAAVPAPVTDGGPTPARPRWRFALLLIAALLTALAGMRSCRASDPLPIEADSALARR